MTGADDDECVRFLRDRGLQVTYQRLAIFKALLDSTDHPTAEGIHRLVAKSFPMISLNTVYKTLEKFREKGVIQRVLPFADARRYETFTEPHDHMVCEKCQALLDTPDLVNEISLRLPEGHGFKILGHNVIVRGYCPDCSE